MLDRRRPQTLFEDVVQGATSFATGLVSEEIDPADGLAFHVVANVLTSGGTPWFNLQVEHSIDGRLWVELNTNPEIFRASLVTTGANVISGWVDLGAAGPRVRARIFSNTGDVLFARVLVNGRVIAPARLAALGAPRATESAARMPVRPAKADCGCAGNCGPGRGKTLSRLPSRADLTLDPADGSVLFSGNATTRTRARARERIMDASALRGIVSRVSGVVPARRVRQVPQPPGPPSPYPPEPKPDLSDILETITAECREWHAWAAEQLAVDIENCVIAWDYQKNLQGDPEMDADQDLAECLSGAVSAYNTNIELVVNPKCAVPFSTDACEWCKDQAYNLYKYCKAGCDKLPDPITKAACKFLCGQWLAENILKCNQLPGC